MSNTNQDTDHDLLKHQVEAVINGIEEPDEDELNIEGDDGEPCTAMDYVFEALDIEYVVGSDRAYKGARLLVCCGGPNVWVNTRTGMVEGYWWGDSYSCRFTDNLGIDDACRELWECGQ
jgi:hypothetical protein